MYTAKDINAQFILAKSELQKLKDMIDMMGAIDNELHGALGALDGLNGEITTAVDCMNKTKEEIIYMNENYDNNFALKEELKVG